MSCKDENGVFVIKRVTVKDGGYLILSSSVWHRGVKLGPDNKSVVVFYYLNLDSRIKNHHNKDYAEVFASGTLLRHLHPNPLTPSLYLGILAGLIFHSALTLIQQQ